MQSFYQVWFFSINEVCVESKFIKSYFQIIKKLVNLL
jgi:hypothetical protein